MTDSACCPSCGRVFPLDSQAPLSIPYPSGSAGQSEVSTPTAKSDEAVEAAEYVVELRRQAEALRKVGVTGPDEWCMTAADVIEGLLS